MKVSCCHERHQFMQYQCSLPCRSPLACFTMRSSCSMMLPPGIVAAAAQC